MRPVILSAADRGDGTSLLVVSSRPGRRLQLVVSSTLLHAPDQADTLTLLVDAIERKGTP